jgi:hypothetical protein
MNESPVDHRECVTVNIVIRVPYSIPLLNLSLIYSDVYTTGPASRIDTLSISTQAGSITCESQISTNHSAISTLAGAIQGEYSLGESLSLTTSLGWVDVTIIPDRSIPSPKGTLITNSDAGRSHILLYPLGHRNQIAARHTAAMGNLCVDYPRDWEGTVLCQTHGGLVSMGGPELQVVESRRRHGAWLMRGIRGDQPSSMGTIDIHTSLGSIDFEVMY